LSLGANASNFGVSPTALIKTSGCNSICQWSVVSGPLIKGRRRVAGLMSRGE
jgi:hypothetical protein